MRVFSRKFHAMLDYMSGLLLIASPWLFNFNGSEAAKWVAIIMGGFIILMSLITDYEGGLSKMLSMATHLRMDVIGGIFLAASPWIFGFASMVYLPHLILGLMEIAAGLMTHKESEHPTSRHMDDLRHAH